MGLLRELWGRGPGGDAGAPPADVTSHAMREAVARWYRLYYDDRARPGYDPRGRLAYTVVTRLVRTVFNEYSWTLTGGGARAEGLRRSLGRLDEVREEALGQCLIGGECLVKPVPEGAPGEGVGAACGPGAEGVGGFGFVVIPRPAYRVLGRDERGRATGYATAEVTQDEAGVWTLVEERRLGADGRVALRNRLYHKKRGGTLPRAAGFGAFAGELGSRVPLDSLDKYAGLAERAVLPVPLYSTGLIELKMPVANCVDGSHDGVSVYAAAAGAIEAAARLEADFNDEFAHAKSRIVASRDMLRPGEDGGRRLEDELFIALDEDPANVGITVFSPAIREKSFLERKNDYLRTVENIIGLNRGLLSDAAEAKRTATEISNTEGEYNLTVQHIQGAWRTCVERLADCCGRLGQMYLGWAPGAGPVPQIDFGDGVLFNRQQAWQEYERMVQNGWLRPEVALAWYFGIDPGDEAALARLRPGAGAG